MNVYELMEKFSTEDACRAHLEQVRWPNGVFCPRCHYYKVSRLVKRRQFTCTRKSCRFRFSVTTDTIMHASKLPLRKWFIAIALLSDAKKSMSSLQLHRHLHISKECSWHLAMRIREAMRENVNHANLFRGIVEVDEHYSSATLLPNHGARRRGGEHHPIIGAYDRATGKVRTVAVRKVNKKTVTRALQRNVDLASTHLRTDQWLGYRGIGKLCLDHHYVNHSIEYVSIAGTHTNSIESAWSLFVRSMMGSFHKVSAKHLPRYLNEFDSRFNARHLNGQFFGQVLGQGMRLRRCLPMSKLVGQS